MSPVADHRPSLVPPAVEPWRVEVVEESTSTNAEVSDRFRRGERGGFVLAAEHQSAGRGRLGRAWVSPPRASLTASVLLEPEVSAERWTWLPLLTGLAAARAAQRVADVHVALKWPNDVLLTGADVERKVGGILLERVDHEGRAGAVIGVGLNVHQTAEELPLPTATSLALEGADVDRAELLVALLRELGTVYDQWSGGGDLRPEYLELCVTPGRAVRVTVPGGEVEGEAVDVDASGRLVVRTAAGEQRLGAGDVVHVRPAPPRSVG